MFSLLFLLLAFTDIPYHAYHQLSLKNQKLKGNADLIILMGGDGMPSPSGLMRSYFTAEAAKIHPKAKIIIALPANQQEKDSLRQLRLIRKELELKGIDSSQIVFEPKGYNTRTQAEEIAKNYDSTEKILIVTSPEHMYRAIRCFEKTGFKQVGSFPTFEIPSDESKLKSKDKKKAKELQNLDLRYNMWSYMQYEIIVLREYFAISYYWLKGWI